MRRRARPLERALAAVAVAVLSAGAAGCDAFAEPSEEQGGDDFAPRGFAAPSFEPVPAPEPMPTFPMPPPVLPPCPVDVPALASTCTGAQLCMYTMQTSCTIRSLAQCTSSLWMVTTFPLGGCPADEPEDDAGVGDEDDAGLEDGS
jgi:hypothetical protein